MTDRQTLLTWRRLNTETAVETVAVTEHAASLLRTNLVNGNNMILHNVSLLKFTEREINVNLTGPI